MGGNIQQIAIVPDPKGGPADVLYQFKSDKRYVDEVNNVTNAAHLWKVADQLVSDLESEISKGKLGQPITILTNGAPDPVKDKLLAWLGLLPPEAIDKLIQLFLRAVKHERVGIVFGLCYDPSVKGVQVAIPNVQQDGLIPVVITAGNDAFSLTPNPQAG
jgi:hypothetical protein